MAQQRTADKNGADPEKVDELNELENENADIGAT